MSLLRLSQASLDDLDQLAVFESENRAFFESMINARPATYYDPGGIEAAIAEAMRNAAAGTAFQFLARNAADDLVARVNLTRIRREHFHSAELGYRVAQAHNGRGYASEAVRLALQFAFRELKLWRVEASVRPENLGSIKVLVRNGFTQFGHSRRSFQLAGAWFDLLHFECHAPS